VADSSAPTDEQIQAAVKSAATCAGRSDGFVNCIDPPTYDFGPITRYGLMCTWLSNAQPNVQSYPITMMVTLTAHSRDNNGGAQPDQQWVKGGTDAETWFLTTRDGGQNWRTSLQNLNLAHECPAP
jgi:hypothetical protein